jgi:hypothetical protein
MGELTILFNETMAAPENLTGLNSSILDVYIVPALDRDTLSEYDAKSVNLTWTVMNYTEHKLILKLAFDFPVQISPLEVQDSLIVHFKQTSPFFFCFSIKNLLHEDSRTLTRKVRKQIEDSELNKDMESTAKGSESGLKVMLLC